MVPGSCGTGCGGGLSAEMIVTDMPQTNLKPGASHTFAPDGTKSCSCGHYGGYNTPSWPLNNLDQQVTCSVDADGNVVAKNVNNPGVEPNRRGGSISHADGKPVKQGCSVATATYSGLSWTETGGDQGCGSTTGPMTMEGSIVAKGYCCTGTTLTPVWDSGHAGCYGSLNPASCPGFND